MQGGTRLASHEELVADLRLVRERGLGHLRRYAVPALHAACRLCDLTTSDDQEPAAVESLLRQAVLLLGGGRSGQAAEYTFGLVQGTKLWTATDRRKAAAKAQGVSVERFRKGYELQIIELVAENILEECRRHLAPTAPKGNLTTSSEFEPQGHNVAPGRDLVPLLTVDDACEFSLPKMLDGAVRVDVLSRSLVNLMNQYATQIARIVQQGGVVRIIILAPLLELGRHLYPLPFAGNGDTVFRRHITAVADRIRYIESLTTSATGSFEVRTTQFIPQYGMVTTWRKAAQDAKTIVQLNFLFTRTERDRPLICIDAHNRWFPAFNDEFESVWINSDPWAEPSWVSSLTVDVDSEVHNGKDGVTGG